MTQWQTVPGGGAPFFKFQNKGDKISGKLLGTRETTGLEPGKMQTVLDIQTADGERSVGATADIKRKFAKIAIGSLVSIEFTGTKKITGKPSPMKEFDVKFAPPQLQEVK